MKLIYIYLGGDLKGSSVQNKILSQISELNRHGIETEGWFFNSNTTEAVSISENARIFPLKPYLGKHKFFSNNYEIQNYYTQILEKIDKDSNPKDALFLRHGTSGSAYFKLLLKNAHRLFLYIPSNTIRENFLEKRFAMKSSFVSFCFRWFEYYFYFYRWENQLIRKILGRLKGVVVFTPEFGEILNLKSKRKINIIYNRDGVNCNAAPMRNPKNSQNGKINLLFMKGSSMLQPWSGLDRLVSSIFESGSDRFHLFITGSVLDKKRYNSSFVTFKGRLDADELNELCDICDLGVSNLANYLIHFNETTNLKSREYYARGLPFIQANSMPDVENTLGEKYYLRLPNTGDLLDMDAIASFATQMKLDAEVPAKMRQFAKDRLDWSITVGELAESIHKHI